MQAHACPQSTKADFRLLYLGADLKFIAALPQVLREPEYQLVTCGDRRSAIIFLASEIPYDLMLLDFEWRGKEGLELARTARSLPHRKRMPIMLVAGELTSRLKVAAQKVGVNTCVAKAPDLTALSEAIRQLVEPRKKSRR